LPRFQAGERRDARRARRDPRLRPRARVGTRDGMADAKVDDGDRHVRDRGDGSLRGPPSRRGAPPCYRTDRFSLG
jgi:hypothetical protein